MVQRAMRTVGWSANDGYAGALAGYSDGDKFLQLAFIYVGDERREYASMEKKMLKLLNKAKELIEPGPENRPVVPETDKPAAGSIKPVEDA